MKKIVSFVLCITMTLCVISAWAVESEKAIRTDITAEIDYTPIETYNVNGYTYVPVDVLSNYGFEVEYRDENTIDIKRIRYATPMLTRELWESSITEKTYADIINDGKQVYLDGVLANSVSITDGTLMMIDELQKYGGFQSNVGRVFRRIRIKIFEKELQEDYENAENIEEIGVYGEQIYGMKETYGTYKGQVDENGVPNGIGLYNFRCNGPGPYINHIRILGYFKNGKPDGNIYRHAYKETDPELYDVYTLDFIGAVDSSKNVEESINKKGEKRNIENNFGELFVPYMGLDGATLFDPNSYESGVCFENGSICGDSNCRYHKITAWKKGNDQTVKHIKSSNLPFIKTKIADMLRKNKKITEISEFTQYQNGEEVYYNGGIQTISDEWDEYGSRFCNRTVDGAGYYPFTIGIVLNEEELSETQAQMEGDRVLVPCRSLFEEIGATVEWDETEQKVIIAKEDKNIILQIDHNIMTVNDEEIELDTTAKLLSGKTYVPVRAITEALGATVEWNDELKDVIINM